MRRRNKYNNAPCEMDGVTFDSKSERRRYGELKLLEAAGEIKCLQCHPAFDILIDSVPVRYASGRKMRVELDFLYYDIRAKQFVYEDRKGKDNPTSRIKRTIFEHVYGVKVHLT